MAIQLLYWKNVQTNKYSEKKNYDQINDFPDKM